LLVEIPASILYAHMLDRAYCTARVDVLPSLALYINI
jgi:hypothetical protein